MAIEKTTTQNGVRTFHTAGKYCDQDIVVTTAVPSQSATLITKTVTENGTYNASSDSADGYSQVTVTVPLLNIKTVDLNMASGNQEILPTSGYVAIEAVYVRKPDTLIPSNIRDGVTIGGVIGTYTGGGGGGGQFDGIVDGSIQNIVIPSTYSAVKQYFYYWSSANTGLQTLDLGDGVTSIGDSAFYNNRNALIVCKEIDGELFLPRQIVSFGANAFRDCRGLGKGTTLSNGKYTFSPSSAVTSCGNYAFYSTSIGKIVATFSSKIGNYAFSSVAPNEVDAICNAGIGDQAFALDTRRLTKFHIKVAGSVGSNFLCQASGSYYLESAIDFYFDPASNITSLANSSFAGMLKRSYAQSRQVFVLDLRNSTFTSAPSYSFGTSNAGTVPFGYIHVYVPTTCTTLAANAFAGAAYCLYYFSATTPPTAQSSTFSSDTNTYYAVPYNNLHTYQVATNWAAKAAQIVGWVTGVTTLPATNAEGYNLLWYTDIACTTPVQSGDTISADDEYFCKLNGLA